MYRVFKPAEDVVAQTLLLETYEKLKESWKADQGMLEYDPDYGFIMLEMGAIGICNETGKILVTLFLGADAQYISNLVIALLGYKDRLLVKSVTVFVFQDEMFNGSNAILKYSQFLAKFSKQMAGEEQLVNDSDFYKNRH